jgi:26S proteasome regulatory subunit N1
MAQDSEVPKAADKGKGKAVDDAKKDKQQTNGKKEDEKTESMKPRCSTMRCCTDPGLSR